MKRQGSVNWDSLIWSMYLVQNTWKFIYNSFFNYFFIRYEYFMFTFHLFLLQFFLFLGHQTEKKMFLHIIHLISWYISITKAVHILEHIVSRSLIWSDGVELALLLLLGPFVTFLRYVKTETCTCTLIKKIVLYYINLFLK